MTRLAPSPTGSLHLGNARTFLVNWAVARGAGWRIVLRVEDLDTPRVKPGAIEQAVDELVWLGLDWDQPGPGEAPPLQTTRLDAYTGAMARLASKGLVYPCDLTRSQVAEAVSAPHAGDRETCYPASLRPDVRPRAFTDGGTNWRFCTRPGPVVVRDRLRGEATLRPDETVGDFVVWTRRGLPSYQLAVVVDDHASGVTEIVRGDDLLDSAARQALLWGALEYGDVPLGTHLPLVIGPDGRRLAKRHGDTRLAAFREAGVPAERVIGLCAAWSGVLPRHAPEPMPARDFRDGFSLGSMPRDPVVLAPEDVAWLTAP